MIAKLDRPASLAAIASALVLVAIVGSVLSTDATVRGLLIGGCLGVVNLVLGMHFTRKSLRGEPGAVLVNIAAGFGVRFLVLMALLVVFTFVTTLGVSPAAFGFTFVTFVFVYFGIESVMAVRLLGREAA